MTSETRKRRWLKKISPPVADAGMNNWAYIWRFERLRRGKSRTYCLCLLTADRSFRLYIVRPDWPVGKKQCECPQLVLLFRSLLTIDQLAAALASIITRNHATTGDPNNER